MNKKLDHLKEQYEEIKASEELRERAEALFAKQPVGEAKQRASEAQPATGDARQPMDGEQPTAERTKRGEAGRKSSAGRHALWKRWVAAAAVAVVAFVGGLHTSESFAATVASLPGMEGIVRVLTLDRYHFDNGYMQADIVTPQIEGLADEKLQAMINEQLRKDSEEAIALFEEEKQAMEEMGLAEEAHMGWEFNYDIKTDTEELLVVDTYLYNVVGSSSTIHKYYNVDKKNSKLLTLPELMADHPNYVTELSDYIRKEMEKTNESGDGVYFLEYFTKIGEEQLFYVNEDGQLVICFDKYEVAPGAYGSPEFVIPADYFKWNGEN